MQVQAIESMPFAENSYLVHLPKSSEAVVFDPGLEPEKILEALEEQGLELAAILCTHGHADHIAGNGALKRAFPRAPLLIGRGDARMLTDPVANLSASFGIPITSPPADRLLDEGESLEVAGMVFQILEIPGHSPGHIVFLEQGHRALFGGDVLFSGSVGRTDFPGGSFEQLRDGIHQKLYTLADDVKVFPGHGPPTSIGAEKKTNPFVGL